MIFFKSNFLWHFSGCLPQSLLGLIVYLGIRWLDPQALREDYLPLAIVLESRRVWGGLSLGRYVFIHNQSESPAEREQLIRHELGHARQSMRLGPLYLLVIGLPSLLWAGLHATGLFPGLAYGWFYTEQSANRLGNQMDLDRLG